MGAAGRLLDDAIDQLVREHVIRGQLQCFGGLLLIVPTAPEDGRAGLRRDHAIPCVLEHEHLVADTDPKRSAGSTFTDDDADHRHLQLHHLEQVARDGLALSAFFGLQTWECTRSIDQRHHRLVEFLRQLHQAQGLAVAFRIGHTEVAVLAHLGIDPLLLADEHHRAAVDLAEATHHGLIVLHRTVTVQFNEAVVGQDLDVLQGVGPVRMTAHLYAFPRRKPVIDGLARFGQLLLQVLQRGFHVHGTLRGHLLQLLDLLDHMLDRLLELQERLHRLGLGRAKVEGTALAASPHGRYIRAPCCGSLKPRSIWDSTSWHVGQMVSTTSRA